MKKQPKNNKKTTDSNASNSFEEKLAKLGFDVSQPSTSGCDNPDCMYCGNGKLFGYIPIKQKEEMEEDLFAPAIDCNVTFVPGNSDEDTFIYVGEELLKGVTKAKLCYDSETGVPTLELEIVGFSVETHKE